jgi:subtilisin family serine protease
MTAANDRFGEWRERRARRLEQLGLLGASVAPGGLSAYYVADEVLVRDDHRQLARDVLTANGHGPRDTAEDTATVGGFRRYRSRDLDVVSVARSIRTRARQEGDTRPAATPNHVFMGTPFEHGGPFGPPVPAPASTGFAAHRPDGLAGLVKVAVVDTGVWRDSPLPPGYYSAAPEDFETDVDVDKDGLLDGDVGHANFIAGVIAQHSPNADIQMLRVLDTFGVCTELELVTALSRLDNATKVVNLSLGGYTVDDQPPLVLQDALTDLFSTGDRLVIAAAGNDGQRTRPFWPAAFAAGTQPWHHRMVAVAAHDGQKICDWSNAGDWVTLSAPGLDVSSTYVLHAEFSTGWALWSGTSFATPHAVAAIARQLAAGGSSVAALRAVLRAASVTPIGDHPGLL